MRKFACLVLAAVGALPFFVRTSAQEPPKAEAPALFNTYDELFDSFEKRRQVLVTRLERLQEKERVEPAELEAVESELRALDREYTAALRAYIAAKPAASDVMPARFELAVALSRLDENLDEAVKAADDFMANHGNAELAADMRFLRAQTLFRMEGREQDALQAFEQFIEKHPEREDADAARMMRVRTLLFLDRVEDAKRSLKMLLDTDRVKKDSDAVEFLQRQLANLDWVGRELPAFAAVDTAGQAAAGGDFAGKPLLLFVWDSTSGACLGELPYVQEAARRHEGRVAVLGIGVNESKAGFEQFLAKGEVKFRNVWIDREQENSLVKKLNVSLIPFNVLVDAAGKVYRYDVRSDDLLRYAARLNR